MTENDVPDPDLEATIRVAVVDDHSMVTEGLGRIVSGEAGFELVGTAGSVAEALVLVERDSPQVVLMDYHLPDGDGADATRTIMERWPTTKVIMLSGSGGQGVLARAIASGCAGFLSKTRPASDVIAAIRTASRGESVIRADELVALLSQVRGGSSGKGQGLSIRELEVLQLLAKGYTTDAIAGTLVLSVHTVRNHIANVISKLGAHSKLEAVAFGLRDNVITVDDA